jgi:hypothetical protein
MKTITERILDYLYLLNKRLSKPLPKYPKQHYKRVPAKQFQSKLRNILGENFGRIGFELHIEDVWIRKRLPLFVDKLYVQQLEQFLPDLLKLSVRPGIHCLPAFQLYKAFGGNADSSGGPANEIICSLWLSSLAAKFPRQEADIDHRFVMYSFATEEAMLAEIEQAAQVIAHCADRYFSQFQCLDDAIKVMEDLTYKYKKRTGVLDRKGEAMLGILYLLTGQKEKAIARYQATISCLNSSLEKEHRDVIACEMRGHLAILQRGLEMMHSGEAERLIESFELPLAVPMGESHGA